MRKIEKTAHTEVSEFTGKDEYPGKDEYLKRHYYQQIEIPERGLPAATVEGGMLIYYCIFRWESDPFDADITKVLLNEFIISYSLLIKYSDILETGKVLIFVADDLEAFCRAYLKPYGLDVFVRALPDDAPKNFNAHFPVLWHPEVNEAEFILNLDTDWWLFPNNWYNDKPSEKYSWSAFLSHVLSFENYEERNGFYKVSVNEMEPRVLLFHLFPFFRGTVSETKENHLQLQTYYREIENHAGYFMLSEIPLNELGADELISSQDVDVCERLLNVPVLGDLFKKQVDSLLPYFRGSVGGYYGKNQLINYKLQKYPSIYPEFIDDEGLFMFFVAKEKPIIREICGDFPLFQLAYMAREGWDNLKEQDRTAWLDAGTFCHKKYDHVFNFTEGGKAFVDWLQKDLEAE